MDMTASIEPRSDQWNADDLIAGPRTVTIERVTAGAAEQPFDFHLVETPGRAYRPSKGMRRVIVAAWGSDTTVYAGRQLTLYREPTIKFGKDEVGGIRISHLSHISRPVSLALTITRGKRDSFIVQPLEGAAPQALPPASKEQQQRIGALLTEAGINDKIGRVTEIVGRPITSARDLDAAEAGMVIDRLEADRLAAADPGVDADTADGGA